MFLEWVGCTSLWIYSETSPLAAYAIWLVVNQYRHATTWFRSSGGGPSIVLQRERCGTLWYIATIVFIRVAENKVGPALIKSGVLVLHPQMWIPLVLIFIIGVYLLKFGLLLRIYKYKHRPLPKGRYIRLLRLRAQPCLPNAPIQCDMIHTALRSPPQYTAVSHRWEPAGRPQEMILIDGGLFSVSQNLYPLLLAKRSNLYPRYFWIDSICINESDTTEKSKQVRMMQSIFKEAEMTLGWLGIDSGAKKAFGFIKRINETTSAASLCDLCLCLESDWIEFKKLVAKEWFERIWIIQEIAVAKAAVLRYGDQEVEWNVFIDALIRVISFGSQMENDLNTLDQQRILNALIIEEVKFHIANTNLVKLKDALKLVFKFKATLPIDKVYALLGLIDERHTPLFHASFGASDGIGGNKLFDVRTLWKDGARIIEQITNILGTASGTLNSREGRAVLSSGTENALRYTVHLSRDLGKLTKKIEQIQKGIPDFEQDLIQPDYSGKITAQRVYSYVARDLIRQGDTLSFIRYAGVGLPRNSELTDLPSWVPDWSADIDIYLLPWRKCGEMNSTESDSKVSQRQNDVFQDGGSNFLFVKGMIVGTIAHLAPLTQDYDDVSLAKWKGAEEDFVQLSSKLQAASKLAQEHVAPCFETEHTMKEAFYRALTADTTVNTNFIPSSSPLWIPNLFTNCPISEALWPQNFNDYWEKIPDHDNPEVIRDHQNDIFKKYLFVRHMKSSTSSKLAHLIREDIAPSFSEYGRQVKDQLGKGPLFMLSEKSASLLSGYAQYVDYTLGRSFIVTDSGLMGLAPSDSRVGDVLIQIQTDSRVIWLTLREEQLPDCSVTDTSKSTKAEAPSDDKNRQPSYPGTFRLIGEAYVHTSNAKKSQSRDSHWFTLW